MSCLHEFRNPLPVVTPVGGGYAIYVRDGGTWENDVWAVAMEEGGQVRHFRSDQIRVHANATFDISKE
jgi:hypothetical protein